MMVLQVLREHQLYAKLSKCEFHQRRVQYLGHVISEEGISVDPKNIESIMDFSTPNNVTNVISFICISGYYRRFIEGLYNIFHPITSLHMNNVNFVWSENVKKAFSN